MSTLFISQELQSIILIDIELTNTSPLIIGTGNNETADIEIARYPDGTPYIPGAAYIGVLKHLFFDTYNIDDKDTKLLHDLTYWWGNFKNYFDRKDNALYKAINNNKIEYQSHIIANDFKIKNETEFTISIRDGIELEEETQLTKKDGKYDTEILESGAVFQTTLKFKIRKNVDESTLYQILHFLKNSIGACRYGRNTTSGYGEMKNKCTIFNIKRYTGKAWIDYLNGIDKPEIIDIDGYKETLNKNSKDNFIATIDAEIWKSLMVGEKGAFGANSDKTYIKYKSNDKEELPLTGRSYRQALIKRMQRIANTLGLGNDVLKDLRGFANYKDNNGKQSKLFVKETSIKTDTVTQKIHHRIQIDHFTGGTVDSAKFDSTPLWHKDETLKMEICIRNYTNKEAALLLCAIKDLVTKDMPIGGEKSIGRGRLNGTKIELNWNDSTKEQELVLIIENEKITNANTIDIDAKTALNKLFNSINT